MEFESTVGDDIPVTVRCSMAPAEPDVGIMYPFPEDLEVLIDDKDLTSDLTTEVLDRIRLECTERYYEDEG